MSQPFSPLPWFSFERKLSGAARVCLGFVTGALFALLPIYYFYMGRDAGLRAVPASTSAGHPSASADVPRRRGDTSPKSRTALRLA